MSSMCYSKRVPQPQQGWESQKGLFLPALLFGPLCCITAGCLGPLVFSDCHAHAQAVERCGADHPAFRLRQAHTSRHMRHVSDNCAKVLDMSKVTVRVLTASSDRTAEISLTADGHCLHTLTGHGNVVRSAVFYRGVQTPSKD